MKIYLAGPMDNCTEDEAKIWRNYCAARIDGECLDPTRRGLHVLQINDIVELDKQDIDDSDVVLANCWRPNMVGTHFELMYAWDRDKEIVVVAPLINVLSPWIKYHSHKLCTTLTEACDYINYNKFKIEMRKADI